MNFNTCLLHGKNATRYPDGATLVPVSLSNAFRYETIEELERVFSHKKAGYAYSRIGTLLNLLTPGDEIIASGCLYGGTIGLLGDLEKLGIHTHFVPRLDAVTIRAAFTDRTRCVFGEVIANPALNVLDISQAAQAAHAAGIPLIVDSTTATPSDRRQHDRNPFFMQAAVSGGGYCYSFDIQIYLRQRKRHQRCDRRWRIICVGSRTFPCSGRF